MYSDYRLLLFFFFFRNKKFYVPLIFRFVVRIRQIDDLLIFLAAIKTNVLYIVTIFVITEELCKREIKH